MTPLRIPFNRAVLTGYEYVYLAQAIVDGHISGNGKFTKQCQALLERELGCSSALLTTSCTHALEMTALLLDLQPGDEVIVPSFTFVSTVNAYVLRGVRPVFCDIRPDTLNIDESKLARLITPRTKALVVVHYAGIACEMEAILALAAQHGLVVIEDNAHGLFGAYHGQPLGTFGDMATLSFHETKNFTCGEGGALLINDPKYLERAEIVREKGTNRSQFFRGQVDKYTWVDLGSSYALSDMLAAFLFAQLEARASIQNKRARIWHRYQAGLQEWALEHAVALPQVPPHCAQAYHMFYLLTPSLTFRQGLIQYLKQHGILSVFHYVPLHLSGMGQRFGAQPGDCPVTEDISVRLLRLPFYNDLTESEQAEVIGFVQQFA